MNKVKKIFSYFLILVGLCFVVACSKGKSSGIKGYLTIEEKRNELEVTADFDQNSKLEDSTTSVAVKLYTEDETYKTNKELTLVDGIKATTSFTNLEQNTKYIIKLFVTVDGYEEEIAKAEATTKNNGNTEETAISITTVEQFLEMKSDPSAYFRLDADLDFTGKESIGLFTNSTRFRGYFDGNGHKLMNFRLTSQEYTGLFGYMEEATVKDLTIENATVELENSAKNLGTLAGRADKSTITNVKVNGCEITNKSKKSYSSMDAYVGGLIGRNDGSKVENCALENVKIELVDVKPSASYLSFIGLFIGHNFGVSEITNCSTKGNLDVKINGSGIIAVGGFVGVNDASKAIKSSYTICDISVTKGGITNAKELLVGGFVGGNIQGSCSLDDCLAIADVSTVSSEKEEDALNTNLASTASIGGLVGKVRLSSFGINNCYFKAKSAGIKIACKALEEEKKDNYKLSLTIANLEVSQDKIQNVYAYNNISSVTGMELEADNVSVEKITVLSEKIRNVLENGA